MKNINILKRDMFDHDSLLLYLTPVEDVKEEIVESLIHESGSQEHIQIPNVVPVSLSEPNVLVLDQAEYAFDNGEWMSREELLRIDNEFREKLGYPLRMETSAQPWVDQTEEKAEHTLSLRFNIESEVDVDDTMLALENKTASIQFNGRDKFI